MIAVTKTTTTSNEGTNFVNDNDNVKKNYTIIAVINFIVTHMSILTTVMIVV